MATSGTASFDLDLLSLIEEAYELVGIDPRSGYDLRTARRSLDLLMREWGNRGINFWTVKETVEPVTAGQSVIILDGDTIDILDAVWRLDVGGVQQDRTMTRMSVTEYSSLAYKTQTGDPSRFWVNRTNPPVVNIWPVPVEDGEFVHWKLRSIEDTGAYTNTMDIPPRFLPALTTGLAFQLAIKTRSAAEKIPLLQQEYERQFSLAADEDRERSAFRVVPDLTGY